MRLETKIKIRVVSPESVPIHLKICPSVSDLTLLLFTN